MADLSGLSDKVLKGLSRLGFTEENITRKAEIYDNLTKASSLYHKKRLKSDVELIISGSRREGISKFWESDTDEMLVPANIMCVEADVQKPPYDKDTKHSEDLKSGLIKLEMSTIESQQTQGRCSQTDIVVKAIRSPASDQIKQCRKTTDRIEELNKCLTNELVGEPIEKQPRDSVFLEMQHKGAPAGYVFLKVAIGSILPSAVNAELICRHGMYYLSNRQNIQGDLHDAAGARSLFWQNDLGWMRQNIQYSTNEIKGPAQPFVLPMPMPFNNKKINYDHVLALPCTCNALNEWCERPRKFGWPSTKVIDCIKRLPAPVVPTGIKGSPDEFLQWRVSFTLAELELVRSFNNTQFKIFVLFKMLVKSLLEPKLLASDGSSRNTSLSYIAKNVVFWLAENTPVSDFTDSKFADRFVRVVSEFRTAVAGNYLPCYMLPSRNLCNEKLTESQRSILLRELTHIVAEGFNIVHKIPDIQDEIGTADETELDEKAKRRYIQEYLLHGIYTLPTDTLAEMIDKALSAETQKECFSILTTDVFPYLRQHDNNGPFGQIKEYSDEDLIQLLVSEIP